MYRISYKKEKFKNLKKINNILMIDTNYYQHKDVILVVSGNTIVNIYYKKIDNIVEAINELIELVFDKMDKFSIILCEPLCDLISKLLNGLSIFTIDVVCNQMKLTCNTKDVYCKMSMSNNKVNDFVSSSVNIAKEMRKHYFKISKPLTSEREEPIFGRVKDGMPISSLGPFPEFVVSTFPCSKTKQGFCIPCFFSKVEMPEISTTKIFSSFLKQMRYIIDNFDNYVIDYQCRIGQAKETIKEVTFCLACNGSIFSNSECLNEDRIEAFKMLLKEMQKRQIKTKVYLESCVDDYLKFIHSKNNNEELLILKELNTIIVFGFESYDEFSRDKIYVKNLKLEDFEKVYTYNELNGIGTGAFLYTGYHSMIDSEIIIDFVKTLCFITSKNILPVLMFSNIQKYTIPHLLYLKNKYLLMDPYTGWTLFKILIWFTQKKQTIHSDIWLTGDVYGGPPIPDINIFTNMKRICCQRCSDNIQKALQYVRRSLDVSIIDEIDKLLRECSEGCHDKYLKFLNKSDLVRQQKALDVRVAENICFCKTCFDEYLFEEDMGLIKKMLLCYGLNVSEKTYYELEKYNKIFGKNKHIHIAQIQLPNGEFVNANIQEEYCKTSPFALQIENGNIGIYRLNKKICDVNIQQLPSWAFDLLEDGTPLIDVLVPHGDNVLSLAEHRPCCFKQNGRGCKFCTSITYTNKITEEKRMSRLREALKCVKRSGKIYSLALSGGTTGTPDRGIVDFIKIIKAAKEVIPDIKISVEVAPPSGNEYLDMLFEEKICSITMNMEFYDQEVRNRFCPGKSTIPLSQYFESLRYSVKKLGCGNVSSVLIAGIENIESTIMGAKRLMDIGVIPTIIPFRPYDNCELVNYGITDVDCLIDIERDLEQYAITKKFHYCKGEGCVGCNACIGVKIKGEND